ncbi:hypothetical protein V6N11_053447 [Hibiscus sabdariffa]|uniref:NADH dehydrogenase [ubiquinone] iron-sulfur protein 4, mitochondrial n=1 Tax=Hibiscus sabdariffa TaxID=183260 RepID=A0ABR2UCZ0_9ROSI
MACFVQRVGRRPAQVLWKRCCSSDALMELDTKPGEVGMVSGVPEQHLKRRVIIYSPLEQQHNRAQGKLGNGRSIFYQHIRDPYANVGEAGLEFDTEEAAKAFVEKYGWEYQVKKRHTPLLKDAAGQQVFSSVESCQDDVSCNKLSSTVSESVASVFSDTKPVDRADYSSTSHVPPPLSSEFKFPAKLLVYQRRPKVLLPVQQAESSSTSIQQPESLFCQYNELLSSQQTGSLFLSSQQSQSGSSQQHGESQQAEFCDHQESSSGFSAISNFPVGISQVSRSSSQVSNCLDDTSGQLSRIQECSVKESSNIQEVSEEVSDVSQESSSYVVSNVKISIYEDLYYSILVNTSI